MSFKFTIPLVNNDTLELNVRVGESLFILGSNGSGKSSIIHKFYTAHHSNSRRIAAHRQSWFQSNEMTLLPENKRAIQSQMSNTDMNVQSRYKDDYSMQRPNLAIQELIDFEFDRQRAIGRAFDEDNFEEAEKCKKSDPPIKVINELLLLSNIPVKIFINEKKQVVASKSGSELYSVTELSDGERNALLLAAQVLTAKKDTLILIDEPERHLHRSIISPLLNLLFAKRNDCAFIISTHDVMLPLDNPSAQTLLVRDCTYANSTVTSWDATLIEPETAIDEDLKSDILGSRRMILFVEGTEQSLDKPLYSLLFPNVTVVAKESCHDVKRAVIGIRDSHHLHWVRAYGIVDNDRRTKKEIDQLKEKGIYALPVYSVESIYYHPEVQRMVTERHTKITGEDVTTRVDDAQKAAIDSIEPHIERLCVRAIEKEIRAEVLSKLPKREEIASAEPINISISISDKITKEQEHLKRALKDGNLERVIARYPIRETQALDRIVSALGFQDRKQYEGAVRRLLIDSDEALMFVKSLFADLENDIDSI